MVYGISAVTVESINAVLEAKYANAVATVWLLPPRARSYAIASTAYRA